MAFIRWQVSSVVSDRKKEIAKKQKNAYHSFGTQFGFHHFGNKFANDLLVKFFKYNLEFLCFRQLRFQ